MSPHERLKWKSRVFAAIVILTNSFGNYFIAKGMKSLTFAADSPLALIKAIFVPSVTIGILLLITWLLARMMFLSFADLSYMLPITAFGYVISALLGLFLLGETISPMRWVGTLLITGGTMLVGSGQPHTGDAASGGESGS
jgi:drug/metabolite transporter (DMT)-like permease